MAVTPTHCSHLTAWIQRQSSDRRGAQQPTGGDLEVELVTWQLKSTNRARRFQHPDQRNPGLELQLSDDHQNRYRNEHASEHADIARDIVAMTRRLDQTRAVFRLLSGTGDRIL
jgi:hypothetical protein